MITLNNVVKQYNKKVVLNDISLVIPKGQSVAFTGAMTGELFHIRLVKERKIGLSATFFVALLAVVRNGVIQKYPISKLLLWVMPPVSDVVSWFSNAQYFDV